MAGPRFATSQLLASVIGGAFGGAVMVVMLFVVSPWVLVTVLPRGDLRGPVRLLARTPVALLVVSSVRGTVPA